VEFFFVYQAMILKLEISMLTFLSGSVFVFNRMF